MGYRFILLYISKLTQPLLTLALKNSPIVFISALILISTTAYQATRLCSEFLPQLDEHDIDVYGMLIPGTVNHKTKHSQTSKNTRKNKVEH